jgi:polyhydroxyalkanoate synthase subunit PhaC
MTDKAETGARASAAIGGGDPVASLDPQELFAGLRDLLTPQGVAKESLGTATELAKILVGSSAVAPKPKDKRFDDPTWALNPFYKRLGQAYLAWADSVHRLVESDSRDDYRLFRARSVARLLTDSLAPTNFLPTNPAAIKRAYETGGLSVLRGTRNWLGDVRHNRGMPSQVDRRPYEVGKNLAATPGAVVHREEIFELLHYNATTPKVHARPFLLIPPQVNKYYFLDLAPGRSLTEYLIGQGLQFFTIVWRDPQKQHGHWGMEEYVAAQLRAIDVVREITGSDDVNSMGVCAGGLTSSLMLGHLAATHDERVKSASWVISMVDSRYTNVIKLLATKRAMGSMHKDAERGKVYDRLSVAHNFAWMRPNDLVFNYVVNNWLMGEAPPSFDILAWNSDSTNLAARFDADMLDIYAGNKLSQPGAATVLGTPIDLGKVDCDAFVVAGITDHITPWKPCWMTTQLLGGRSEVVITSTGHIQTVVNPPGKPRARYYGGPANAGQTPEQWLEAATENSDSWWPRYAEWLKERSGPQRDAPTELGSAAYPPIEPAPGRYVFSE